MISDHTLDDEDTVLLEPICRSLGLPFQPPVNVTVQKKALKEDPHTGRKILYTTLPLVSSSFPSRSCSAFVAVKSTAEFGQIESFFTYRSTQFAVIRRFQHCSHHSALILVPDWSSTTKDKIIHSLENLSCPLVVANNDKELWILNHH